MTLEQRFVGGTDVATFARTYLVDASKREWLPLEDAVASRPQRR